MKRKLLREFADYLERGRTPFNVANPRQCVSWQACRFNGDVKDGVIRGAWGRGSTCDDLVRIFGMSYEQASGLYAGWDDISKTTRKVAAKCVRYLAGTGKVDWDRALKR